jgi:hypothetical protein
MKVFVLGGYGKTGIKAIKLLADSDLITKIAVAGRNLERAEKAASEIGEKAIAIQVDGTDEQKLTSLLAGYDILVNAATYNAVSTFIKAAIGTGIHYCDMDFVEEVLQLEPEAKAAGITAILAAGISPCISNLMGIHAANQLDEVEQLQLGRASIYNFQRGRELTPRQWLKDPKESLTELHEFKPFITGMMKRLQRGGLRMVMDYRDGQWVELDPIRNGLAMPQLEGGTIVSYPYVSCDSFWGALPNDIASVPPVEVWFSPLPPPLHDYLRVQALRVRDETLDPEVAVGSFFDTIERDPDRWLTLPENFVLFPDVWARAVGYKDGRAARHTCWFTATSWDVGGYFLTSAALAAAVRKILRGEVIERGVMHAQTVFEPQSFFDEIDALIEEYLPDGSLIDNSFEWF